MHLVAMSIATITFYAFLLTAMLVGLLRQRQARSFGVWKMLCQQVRYLLTENFELISMDHRLGMGMVCIGGRSRGAYFGKPDLTENCLYH
jgi:hypothetical protein